MLSNKSNKVNSIKSSKCVTPSPLLSSGWLCNAEVKVQYKGTTILLEKFSKSAYVHWLDARSPSSLESFDKQLTAQIECLGILGYQDSSICLRSLEYLEEIKRKRKVLRDRGTQNKPIISNPDKSTGELTNTVTDTFQHDPFTDKDLVFSDEPINNISACTSPGNISDKDRHRWSRTVKTKSLKSVNEAGNLIQPNIPCSKYPVKSDLATKIALFESLSRHPNSFYGKLQMRPTSKEIVKEEFRNHEKLHDIDIHVSNTGHIADVSSFEHEPNQNDTKPGLQESKQVKDKLLTVATKRDGEYSSIDKHYEYKQDILEKLQKNEKIEEINELDQLPSTLVKPELSMDSLIESASSICYADENEEIQLSGRISGQRTTQELTKNTQLKESILRKISICREIAKQTELNKLARSSEGNLTANFEKKKEDLRDILHFEIEKSRSQRIHWPEQNVLDSNVERVDSKPFTRVKDLMMRERVGLILFKHRILLKNSRIEEQKLNLALKSDELSRSALSKKIIIHVRATTVSSLALSN